jgi:hypothetical protein
VADDDAYIFDIETRTLSKAEPKLPPPGVDLVDRPCYGGHDNEFVSFPENGACACGHWKHHVHGTCGEIIQYG